MNEGQTSPNNLLDTTDCLEAVGVFRGWKNFLFLIIILCLLLLQTLFWLVSTGYVKTGDTETVQAAVKAQDDSSVITAGDTEQAAEASEQIAEAPKQAAKDETEPVEEPNQLVEAAKQAAEEPNQLVEVAKQVAEEPNQSAVTEPQHK